MPQARRSCTPRFRSKSLEGGGRPQVLLWPPPLTVLAFVGVDWIQIVDFFSESCGPCRMIAPAFKALAKEYEGRAVFAKVRAFREQIQDSGSQSHARTRTSVVPPGGCAA